MVKVPIPRETIEKMTYSDIVWAIALLKAEIDKRDKKANDLMVKLKEYNFL